MNEPKLRVLLTEVADDVEPRDRLGAIRARTHRSRRHLWVPVGAALVAASVVGAMALTGGLDQRTEAPGPAGTTSTSPSPTTGESTPSPPVTEPPGAVAVYYVGDTPDGPRLYREFRRLAGDPLQVAVDAAVGRGQDDRPLAPLDPDYRVPWPGQIWAGARVVPDEGVIEISLAGGSLSGPETNLRDRGALSEAEAALAVEAVIRTAQAAVQERLPVRFLLHDEITDQVLGVPASEPLAQGRDLEVLAHVSISSPSEGQQVDNDDQLGVSGVGNSYEGNIVTRLLRPDGSEVVEPVPVIAGWMEDRLFPFEATIDLSNVPPGEYVVLSQTDDPSGNQRYHVDTRGITVTD